MHSKFIKTAISSLVLIFGSSLPAFSNTFVFNPRSQQWKAISDDGTVIRTGQFSVWSKGSASRRSSRYPRPYGGAKMPYCMFFSKYYAIHGSNDVPNYNASHGCVRVHTKDASWLSKNFIHVGTRVVIKPY